MSYHKSFLLQIVTVVLLLCGIFLSTDLFAGRLHKVRLDPKKRLVLVQNGKGNAVIVLPGNPGRILQFAAKELQSHLKLICKTDFPVVSKPVDGKVNLMLGESFLKEIRRDLAGIPVDGYVICAAGNRIYLAGRDDPKADPVREAGGWCKWERGTLYAVYDFLERFAGVRFYFPGKMGTIVPRKKNLQIPAMDIREAPDFKTRKFISGVRPIPGRPTVSSWYEGTEKERQDVIRKDGMNRYRLRVSSYAMMAAHGLAQMGYVHRFAKTHPEYFALTAKGERYTQGRLGWDVKNNAGINGQLCLSHPGLREQVYQDAKAFLTGKSASEAKIDLGKERGGVHWPSSLVKGYFDVMPNDSFYLCRCSRCQADFRKGPQAVSDHVWRFARDLGVRLKREKVKGYLNMMAYNPYKLIPSFDLPDNLWITVSVMGPWSYGTKRGGHDLEVIRRWKKKSGNGVGTLWTYPGDPYRQFADLPMMTPRTIGKYFRSVAPYIQGAFVEGETDHYIFQYLNFYVFSKVAWNNSLDVEALLKEHFRLMFGPGAKSMEEAYALLEKCFLKMYERACSHTGDKADYPNEIERWTKIYTDQVMQTLNRLLYRAEKQTRPDPEANQRVQFMRRELFGPMFRARKEWVAQRGRVADWSETVSSLKAGEKIVLDGKDTEKAWAGVPALPLRALNSSVPFRKDTARTVRLLRDREYLYVHMSLRSMDVSRLQFASGKGNAFWFGTEAEALFMPGNGKMYQYACNPAGEVRTMLYEVRNLTLQIRGSFRSQAKVRCHADAKGWNVEMAIPFSELGSSDQDWKANFCYVEAEKGRQNRLYSWSPFVKKSFQEFENFGTLYFTERNLIRNGDLRQKMKNGRIPFWNPSKGSRFTLSENDAYTNTPAMQGTFTSKGRFYCAQQIVGMKPDTRYRFSFFIRGEDLKRIRHGRGGAYATIYFGKQIMVPRTPVDGSGPRIKVVEEFTTGKNMDPKRCSMTIGVFDVTGKVYFDSIRLEEVRK